MNCVICNVVIPEVDEKFAKTFGYPYDLCVQCRKEWVQKMATKAVCAICGVTLSSWEIEDCEMAQTTFLMCSECLLEWEDGFYKENEVVEDDLY